MTDPTRLLERRRRAMGPAYRHFYEQPVCLVRGEGVWVFDADGKRYLDCYNNVPVVGHCNPRVVEALSSQAATLNTHTRYLHENVVELAERLGATFPGDLSVCMFVCTGTEANDLALRIARTVTGNRGVLVTEFSYHGNSTAVFEMSTEDYPDDERPAYLEAFEPPNAYRGRFDPLSPDYARNYAGQVDKAIAALESRGHRPAMLNYDGIFSSNGILTPPAAYFKEVYRSVRAAGGLVVADEVQSGFCRLGEHMWAFQDAGVVPDIVTLGKPMGNGHPLAAVVTTPAIAAAFASRYHYFNTFGGNPVSAAVGLAVLDVIEQEGILQHVGEAGSYLSRGLTALAERNERLGDVRGRGLFFGLEIVEDRASRKPAPERAVAIREYLRRNGILVGTTGPLGNVVKIRPPLVFEIRHADILLAELERALGS